jgi:hypothetical protein
LSTSIFLQYYTVLSAPDCCYLSPYIASRSLRAGLPRIPESYSLQILSRVFAVYRIYTGGPEVVEAGVPVYIEAEEGIQATVSVVGRAEEVFLAVEAARAGLEKSRGSRRRLVRSACIWKLAVDLIKEDEQTYLDTRSDCTYYRECLAAHVVIQVLHASLYCCQLVLHEGLMRAKV